MKTRALAIPVLLAVAVVAFIVVRNRPAKPAGETSGPAGAPVFVNIGTGGMTGVYFQVGSAIMKLMDSRQDAHGLRVSFQSTGGSVYNINAVLDGTMDIGICQQDRQYQAWNGLSEWQDAGPRTELRSICSLYPEAVTLVAAVDADIRTVADLRGKRVNIGNPGSGHRGNALAVLEAAGLDPDKDLNAEAVKAAEAAKLLQDGRIDAFFYTVGHPAPAITEATVGRRAVRLVPIDGDALLAKHPYYARTVIPRDLYPKAENDGDIATIGVLTTVVAGTGTPESAVYGITRELFENLDEFKAMHPAFARLDKAAMVAEGLAAPLHDGARKYYLEAGLIEE